MAPDLRKRGRGPLPLSPAVSRRMPLWLASWGRIGGKRRAAGGGAGRPVCRGCDLSRWRGGLRGQAREAARQSIAGTGAADEMVGDRHGLAAVGAAAARGRPPGRPQGEPRARRMPEPANLLVPT
jgi:hypothetical protein